MKRMGDHEEMEGVGEDNERMATEQDDPEEEEVLTQSVTGKNAKPCKWPCLRCKKNVTSSGVRCETCNLWVHVKCYNIPKEGEWPPPGTQASAGGVTAVTRVHSCWITRLPNCRAR